MTYRESITQAMTELGKDQLIRFCGYNVRYGRAGGTLPGIAEEQLIELPVAENLMAGIAIGLSLSGYRPVLYFERFDFILNAMDALVNHLCKMKELSDGQFRPAMILRVVVGNSMKPLFTGAPHIQDFSEIMRSLLNFPVIQLLSDHDIIGHYQDAGERLAQHKSTMLIEYKDLM